MITDGMKKFIEERDQAVTASADGSGRPHLAAGKGLLVLDPLHLLLNAWFCPRTLENLAGNPAIAVAIIDPATGMGFQLTGEVEKTSQIGMLAGYDPRIEPTGLPQVQYQLLIRVGAVMEFTHGVHSDRPLAVT